MRQVMLRIGTRKEGFLAFSHTSRQRRELQGPVFKGAKATSFGEEAKPPRGRRLSAAIAVLARACDASNGQTTGCCGR